MFASKYWLTRSLPHFSACSTQLWIHTSSFVLLTFDMCTPRLRCTPEQLRQTKAPKLMEAHDGFFAPQSAQNLLHSWASTRRRRFFVLAAVAALSLRYVALMCDIVRVPAVRRALSWLLSSQSRSAISEAVACLRATQGLVGKTLRAHLAFSYDAYLLLLRAHAIASPKELD